VDRVEKPWQPNQSRDREGAVGTRCATAPLRSRLWSVFHQSFAGGNAHL